MNTPGKAVPIKNSRRIGLALASRLWVWASFVSFVALVLGIVIDVLPLIKLTDRSGSAFVLFGGIFAVSVLACCVVLLTKRWHARFSMDSDLSAVQKIHQVAVPRVGGLPISLAAAAGVIWMGVSDHPLFSTASLVLLCGLPVFLIGFTEDLTKQVSVKLRFQATFLGGLLACAALGAVITSVNIAWINKLLAIAPVAWCFTAFAMSGYSNAINMIDGLNGLASGVVCILAIGLCVLALNHQAMDIALYCIVLIAAVLGFWVFNFPVGNLFLGDGGAYFLGFTLAVQAVMLQSGYGDVNAWAILSVLAYPVIEVMYSILRRKLVNANPGMPDRSHFHQYVQRSLQIMVRKQGGVPNMCVNSQATPFLWLFTLMSVGFALYFNRLGMPALGFLLTVVFYVASYQVLGRYIAKNRQWE
ncbi:MraY family glycosyltransferase [Limnobacter parvus]|uniref:Glycosyltransferase n=1 Tax=Limnobacter parvus TaxID=2939690 RepID=A0ABT1XF28_9BURK|nr:glycosyltransferase [Limnobacter parvus]MCR2745203.1 glycosyltransferase [Limnobacter parvus]